MKYPIPPTLCPAPYTSDFETVCVTVSQITMPPPTSVIEIYRPSLANLALWTAAPPKLCPMDTPLISLVIVFSTYRVPGVAASNHTTQCATSWLPHAHNLSDTVPPGLTPPKLVPSGISPVRSATTVYVHTPQVMARISQPEAP